MPQGVSGGGSVIDRTKYNWTATKIEACIKFDFNLGDSVVAMAKLVLENDAFFRDTDRYRNEQSCDWLVAISQTAEKSLKDMADVGAIADNHEAALGVIYIAGASSVMMAHLSVSKALEWCDEQIKKYEVVPDFDFTGLLDRLENPDSAETQKLLADVSERQTRAAELAREERNDSLLSFGKSAIKLCLGGAVVFVALYLAVGLFFEYKEGADLQKERAQARERARARLAKAKEEAERVRTYATNHSDWQLLDPEPQGFGDLHGRVIEIDGLDYLQYRVVYSESHMVIAIPRARHFTSYAFWKTNCSPGLETVVEGVFAETNVKKLKSWSPEAKAVLQCVNLDGENWLMRYAIWGKAENPREWKENYGGFQVEARFESSSDEPGWNLGQGLRAATVNSAKVEDRGFPESVCEKICDAF